jgi:ParB family transcriptional regulator, chromosome partitioning protein
MRKKIFSSNSFDNLLALATGNADPKFINDNVLINIDIDLIQPGRYQHRTFFSTKELQELEQSIQLHGILQPLVLREISGNKYEIVAGERRWRASKNIGMPQVPSIIKKIDDETCMILGIIENIQRENINPIEEAESYKRMMEEFGFTHLDIADKVGKSRSHISNCLRILSLPNIVKDKLNYGGLTFGHAKVLLSVQDMGMLADLADQTIQNNLSVRALEKIALNKDLRKEESHYKNKLLDKIDVEVDLSIRTSKSGKKFILTFADEEEFIEFLNIL